MQMYLASKLCVILGLVCLSVMSLYSVIEIQKSENVILEDSHRIQAQFLQNTAPILQKNLWDINRDDMTTTVQGFFKNPETTKVEVFDEKGNSFLGLQRGLEATPTGGTDNPPLAEENTSAEKTSSSYNLEDVPKEQISLGRLKDEIRTRALGATLLEDMDAFLKRVGIVLYNPTQIDKPLEERDPIGYARLTYTTHGANKRAQGMRLRAFAWSAAISGSVLLTAVAFLIFEILKPLTKLNQASCAVKKGEFVTVEGPVSLNEMGSLISHFNEMVDYFEQKNRLQTTLLENSPNFYTSKNITNIYLQIQNTYSSLLRRKLDIFFYARGEYVTGGTPEDFYLIEASGATRKVTGVWDLDKQNPNTHRVLLEVGKDNRVIGCIELSKATKDISEEEARAIDLLSPTVIGALGLIKSFKA